MRCWAGAYRAAPLQHMSIATHLTCSGEQCRLMLQDEALHQLQQQGPRVGVGRCDACISRVVAKARAYCHTLDLAKAQTGGGVQQDDCVWVIPCNFKNLSSLRASPVAPALGTICVTEVCSISSLSLCYGLFHAAVCQADERRVNTSRFDSSVKCDRRRASFGYITLCATRRCIEVRAGMVRAGMLSTLHLSMNRSPVCCATV